MKLPQIEANETELGYLLRIIADDGLGLSIRQRAAAKAVKIMRKTARNYDAAAIWRFAKLVQPGARFAPSRPPAGYVSRPGFD